MASQTKRAKRDYKKAMEIMVENRYSIRELALVVKIPRTTLHRRMAQEKKNVSEELWQQYLELLKSNNDNKGKKSTNKRWRKEVQNENSKIV